MFDMMRRAFLVGKSKRERVLEHSSTINNKHAWKLLNTLEKSWDRPGTEIIFHRRIIVPYTACFQRKLNE